MKLIPAITLLLAVVLYRIIAAYAGADNSWLLNFSPLAAVALCGALLFPKRLAIIVPLGILFVSDIILNARLGVEMFSAYMLPRYAVLFLVCLLGLRLRESRDVSTFLFASVAGSIGFYLITNTASWIAEPMYAKTFAGWLQAHTVGLPGFPPTWVFFRNSLLSDMGFTFAIIAALGYVKTPVTAPAAH